MKSRMLVPLLLLIIIIGVCSAVTIALQAGPALRVRERQAAEQRWAERNVQRYQIELEDLNCIQVVEITKEKITAVVPGARCSRDARTVSDLFALIRRDGETGARCITQGCACDDRISVQATYDPQWGYPNEIYIRIAPAPNWQHLDYWKYLATHLRPTDCAFTAGDKIIAIRSFTILP
jgi:hypothetical protein